MANEPSRDAEFAKKAKSIRLEVNYPGKYLYDFERERFIQSELMRAYSPGVADTNAAPVAENESLQQQVTILREEGQASRKEVARLLGRHNQLLYWRAIDECNCYHEDGREVRGDYPKSITPDWHLEDCPFWHVLMVLKADESEVG